MVRMLAATAMIANGTGSGWDDYKRSKTGGYCVGVGVKKAPPDRDDTVISR